MYQHRNVIRGFDAHGRTYTMYKQILLYLWNYAIGIGRVSRRSSTLQGHISGEIKAV